jgi:hypothetical protein
MRYDVQKEYVNIADYSPFCHVNEISPQYQRDPFMILFVNMFGKERPVHPDTFHDLRLNEKDIVKKKLVFPTSAFRTVYEPGENVCYKVPVLRRITRSLRDLPKKELLRSEEASSLLSLTRFEGFDFLPEKCHPADDPNFNFIVRTMPKEDYFPWFYVISSQKFSKKFEMNCAKNIIRSWMFYASEGIFFESFHTQNILVNQNADVLYRDLSDVRTMPKKADSVLVPSYYKSLSGLDEFLAIAFDRSVCKQNLDHLFRYSKKLNGEDKKEIKNIIKSEIRKYNLPFPSYSMDYSKDKPLRTPERIPLIDWRN